MQTAIHTAASGLRHAGARQQASAHNSANLTTPASVSLTASARELPVGQGVETRFEGRPAASPPVAAANSAVDHATGQITNLHLARASAHVVRTADDMLGSLLDTFG